MNDINYFIVFIEGVLSIFSPCILPILPVYLSMLANSSVDELKTSKFNRLLIINTVFFILGISTTFFILGSSLRVFSSFFNTNKYIIMILGGIIIIIMGLLYVGILKSNILNQEKRLNLSYKKMSPLSAFILGFTFSFGWTPCIGPILASVMVMATSSDNMVTSNLLILIYTIGFTVPFLIVSLFYGALYSKITQIKKHMNGIKRISGALIIVAGVVMLINGITSLNKELTFRNKNQNQAVVDTNDDINSSEQNKEEEGNQDSNQEDKIAPIDFTLLDQYGNEHTLSDYKGKTVFLNIWATWCPPCREEMPYIEELYKEYGYNENDVVILGVASPELGREGSKDSIIEFLEDNEYSFPVVMDEYASMVYGYGISAFPSTLIIDKEGYITKYVPGAMDKETMTDLIEGER
ncbi:redoxin family protein [Anaerosporobacter sp.]